MKLTINVQIAILAFLLMMTSAARAEIYYYHNDHLGTPQIMTNSSRQVVWEAVRKPFGETTVVVNTIENNLGFPGQYFDAEAGLYQNYFRDYDASLGRYMESDPIGLRGGLNVFSYVSSNPLSYIDLLGLDAQKCLGCLTYAEAGGESTPCRQAVANTIVNRTRDPGNFSGQTDACAVASAPGQYNAFGNSRWRKCMDSDACSHGAENDKINEISIEVGNLGSDATSGSTFFIDRSIDTPPWIANKISQGKMREVTVSGCDSMRFYKIL